MSYASSYEKYAREQEEKENAERRKLNSGESAFLDWEEGKKSASAWRDNWRRALDSIASDGGRDGPSPADLSDLGSWHNWNRWTPCLVYAFEEGYGCEPLSLDKLRGRDRAVADTIVNAAESSHGSRNLFFCTLLLFERTVTGTRSSTVTSKRSRNDEDVFVGYDTFSEIESDEIVIARWSDMEGGSSNYSGNGFEALNKDDEAMFVESILNDGGLRGMFTGIAPDESDEDSCHFYRAAMVICPLKNITKLDEVLPFVAMNKTWWVLRAGCRAAPDSFYPGPSLYDIQPKKQIARHAMKEFRERTTRERLEDTFSIYGPHLEMLMDILKEAKCVPLMLEMISTLATGAKDLPHNEESFSEFISDTLIYLQSTETSLEEKEELHRLAKDRLSYLKESTKDGKPTFTHRQDEAVFNKKAKFASDVEAFLRSDLEEKEFGPFSEKKGWGKSESEKWAEEYFGSVQLVGRCSCVGGEGAKAENIGRYGATATVDNNGAKGPPGSRYGSYLIPAPNCVTLKKSSKSMLRKRTELYDVHFAALEKLSPAFAELMD